MPYVPITFRVPWPAHWRMLLVLVLYAIYLPLSGYTPDQFQFDAAEYWELSLKFTQHGRFSLLDFNEAVRGYVGPLLVMPARLLCHFTGWSMLAGARVLGAGWAALLFGLAIPQLWAQVVGRPLGNARWLVLVGITALFWRDYFNFTLNDMPGLTLLLLGLAALGRKGWAWAGLAGMLLAAVLNIKPIYMASAPGWLWLLFIRRPQIGSRGWRAVAMAAGIALVLLPQWRINQQYFGQNTPFVQGTKPGSPSIYRQQLAWGTRFQRYETSLIPGIPRSLIFGDSCGRRALAREPGGQFASYSHYLRFVARQPGTTAARYVRHLFNGLDLRFPTPYPTQLHPPGQAAFRLLNYAILGLGIWLAVAALWRIRRSTTGLSWQEKQIFGVLLVLLVPCLLVLPILIECRFLLPLHMLVLTGVVASWHPAAWWRQFRTPVRRLGVLALALGWLWGCWELSEATAGQIRPSSEAPG